MFEVIAVKFNRIQLYLSLGCTLGLIGWCGAAAYDSSVTSSLLHSKDALLTQRAELLDAYDKRKAQIAQIQSEIDRLQGYIQDTDRTLRDIDIALRNVK
jgi:hypothetical protein